MNRLSGVRAQRTDVPGQNNATPLSRCRLWQQRLQRILAALILAPGLILAQEPTEVLIINSYHQGYNWSDGEVRGILRSLLQEHPKMLPAIEHLDWKRHAAPECEHEFIETLKLKYGGLKLRLIIPLDDKAIELALAHRDLFGPDVPVVFGGLNFLTPGLFLGQTNVTGVVETKDMVGTLNLILRLQPDVRELVGYHDDTESALANRQALEIAMTNYASRLQLRFIENWSQEELFDALGKLGPRTAVIGLGASHDRTGRLLADDADYLNSVAQRCSVPAYIISEPIVPLFSAEGWESAVWTGVGGSLVSSEQHGELVGELANRVLSGEPADSIPIMTNSQARVAVDWRQMKRFNLSLDALPPGAKVFHQPQSIYAVHKSKILVALGIIVLLSVAVLVLAVNIVLRHKAERQNLRLAAAVEQATELIAILDPEGAVQYVNPAFGQITNATQKESLSAELLHQILGGPGGFARVARELRDKGSWTEQVEFAPADGAPRQLALAASGVRDATGAVTGYTIIGRDVTRETKLEEQVRTSQKMEAIGLLAGGVAHDFNNLLQIIRGYTHLAMDGTLPEVERRENLDQVLGASERAAQLTRQLLAFGRRQPLQMSDTDLNEVVSHLLKMIRRIIGEDLQVDFIPGHQLGNVRADRGQLEQVLLNLCVNGRDAMPHGGRLTLELENVSVNGSFCEAHPWARPGRYVLLSVSDTGCGMDRKTLQRIFEPFFTTKPKGKGTGLGLAVVYGIVQQHDGFVHVYSEPGRGTTFKVYLPIVERRAGDVGNKLPLTERAPTSGTILLVEDEQAVRELAFKVLRNAGYRVLVATNGVEAVQVFQENTSAIDLVLLDVVMPKLGGPEAYARMVTVRPGVPVLYCSGYSADAMHAGFDLGTGSQLIQKPYDPDQLLARVGALLNQARRTG